MGNYIITNRPVQKSGTKFKMKPREGRAISTSLYGGELKDKETFTNCLLQEIYPDTGFIKRFTDPKVKSPLFDLYLSIYEEMRGAKKPNSRKRDVMLFIHGYGHDIQKSQRFYNELKKKYVDNDQSTIGSVIMFLWPSQSHFFSYEDEKQQAKVSGIVLTRFYITLKYFLDHYAGPYENNNPNFNRSYLHVVVQSMGNVLFETMIHEITKAYPDKKDNIFKEVVLVGADIDRDAFEEHRGLERILDYCSRVHVYFHKEDLAMTASRLLHFMHSPFTVYKPLGKFGPSNMQMLDRSIKAVDISDLEDFIQADGVNDLADDVIIQHRYFMYSSKVVADITKVLAGTHAEDIQERKSTDTPGLFRL